MREGAGAISPEHVSALHCQLKLIGGGKGDGYQFAQDILTRLRQNGVLTTLAPQAWRASQPRPLGQSLGPGQASPRRVPASARDRGMYERAWQSRLFNIWLASRMEQYGLPAVLEGDWLQQRCNEPVHQRPVVVVDDAEAAAKRVESWESVVLGPLWGGEYQFRMALPLLTKKKFWPAPGQYRALSRWPSCHALSAQISGDRKTW